MGIREREKFWGMSPSSIMNRTANISLNISTSKTTVVALSELKESMRIYIILKYGG